MDVAEWLRGLGLEQYVPAFRDNDIDGEVLRGLTADDCVILASRRSGTVAVCSTPSRGLQVVNRQAQHHRRQAPPRSRAMPSGAS